MDINIDKVIKVIKKSAAQWFLMTDHLVAVKSWRFFASFSRLSVENTNVCVALNFRMFIMDGKKKSQL